MSFRLTLLSLALVISVCSPSFASAPMCGDLGETIAAPPVVMPHDDGVIVAWYGCPDTDDDTDPRISTFHQQPRAVDVIASHDTAVALLPWGIPKPRGELILRTCERVMVGPAGKRSEVFRPPRGMAV